MWFYEFGWLLYTELFFREQDEELDAIVLTAKTLVSRLKQLNRKVKHGEPEDVDQLQIASFLALFVSDHFGGSDRSSLVERARKSVSGSNYLKPFVCTCATGNSDTMCTSTSQILSSMNDIAFIDLCEKSLRTIKESRGSIVVPIGMLQFGVCRHRALLMKVIGFFQISDILCGCCLLTTTSNHLL